ncbi:MAG: hypothetical protein ACOH1T_04440 [Microbacteriaceae bacterium]
MNNDLPRLPSSTLQVVLNLGEKHASRLTLPIGYEHPELDAEWDEEAHVTSVSVSYPRGQLHLDAREGEVEFHYHRANGEASDDSPFARSAATAVLEWATAFAHDVHRLMPGLEEDAGEAAAWHDAGYTLYVCETEPAQLDLLEVEIEGEILMLPWLGAGTVDHQHADGDNHPIELLWTLDSSENATADVPIARAWLDPRTEEPLSAGIPGVDWNSVGLSEAEALSWLEGLYLNHHVIEDPASAVFFTALDRIAGIDRAAR